MCFLAEGISGGICKTFTPIILPLLFFMACALPPNPAPSTQYPETISHLTLEEKIAQMVMVRIRGDYYSSEHWYRKKLQKYL